MLAVDVGRPNVDSFPVPSLVEWRKVFAISGDNCPILWLRLATSFESLPECFKLCNDPNARWNLACTLPAGSTGSNDSFACTTPSASKTSSWCVASVNTRRAAIRSFSVATVCCTSFISSRSSLRASRIWARFMRCSPVSIRNGTRAREEADAGRGAAPAAAAGSLVFAFAALTGGRAARRDNAHSSWSVAPTDPDKVFTNNSWILVSTEAS
mmetsp:Transcript_27986/g.67237  ORF Transcript_27986/g.67237 Transcript_27986/m.67237 type:complete len:212 (-) Transcript_27986:1865-2500(-)